jgi:hypothetical protein
LKDKIRHTPDINQLLKESELNEFDKIFLSVAHDDLESFKNSNAWLNYHPKEALIFKDPEKTWDQVKSVYNSDFKDLVYGDFPDEKEVLDTLLSVSKRLVTINWDISLESNDEI